MSVLKRQRELKKREKAAAKRAKRHGLREDGFTEPVPTVGRRAEEEDEDDDDSRNVAPVDKGPRPSPARAETSPTE